MYEGYPESKFRWAIGKKKQELILKLMLFQSEENI
jgi:hypothetical protein